MNNMNNKTYSILCFISGFFLAIWLFSTRDFFHFAWLIVNKKEVTPESMAKCFGGISIFLIIMIIILIVTIIKLRLYPPAVISKFKN